MASKKSKILAIAFCAAVMAGIHVNPVLAYHGDEDFNYQHNTTESGLNNPEIHHTADEGWVRPDWEPVHPEGDVNCEEEVANSNITVGDMNKVTADLVANDEKINGKVDKVASDVKNLQEQVNNIETTADTDTHVKEGAATVDQETGKVTMDLVNKEDTKVGEVTIDGLASDKELEKETQKRTESDTKLQEQINNNATAIADETTARVEADAEHDRLLADHKEQIEENAQAIADETTARVEADAEHDRLLADHKEQIEENAQAIADETTARVEADAEHDRLLADHKEQIEENAQAIADETTARVEADAEHDRLLADHKEQIEENAQAIADETTARVEADEALQGQIDAHGQQIGDNTAAIKNHTSVIGVEDSSQLADKYADTNYISDATSMVEADKRLDAAISDVNTRVDGLENRVDGLEGRIDKVGAMSAAIANLRTMGYDPAAPTEVAVGVGQYRDETGMALGLFHYPNRDFMLSLSVSTSGDEYMGGIGATWKFGRKSPEKVAEIKKAQAEADARRAEEQKLAKAEEMKKAAKEAKVQAQMERHAKLAAERAALEEA